MSAQGTYRFYSVSRQTILLVNGEPLGQERVKYLSTYDSFVLQQQKYLNSHSQVVNFTVKRFS